MIVEHATGICRRCDKISITCLCGKKNKHSIFKSRILCLSCLNVDPSELGSIPYDSSRSFLDLPDIV